MLDFYLLFRDTITESLKQHGFDLAPWIIDVVVCGVMLFILNFVKPAWIRIKTWFFITRQAKYFDPFYLPGEIRHATKFYVDTNFQNIPPSLEHEPAFTHAVTARQPLIPFFLNVLNNPENNNKYYIILADSGMGKTTFFINLYYKYKTKLFKKFEIFLVPLNNPQIDDHIRSIPDEVKCKSVILLDALDEDGKAASNYMERIDHLVELTAKFRFVLITCRTQFFPFEEVEPSELNIRKNGGDGDYHKFKKIYLSPFTNSDIRKYLWKKFSIVELGKIIKAYRIVKASPYLMVRPMLLSYIDDLIKSKDGLSNIYEIYHFLIEAWIDREANRKKSSERSEFRLQLQKFSEKIAMKLYSNFSQDATLSISHHLVKPFAKENGIDLDDLVLRSKSLLTRDANGLYKFAHKSILEYFLAVKAYNDFEFLKKFKFQSFTYSKKLYRGLCENSLATDPVLRAKFKFEKGANARNPKIVIDLPDAKLFQLACGFKNVVSVSAKNLKVSNDYLHFIKLIDELKELDLSNNNLTNPQILYTFGKLEYLRIAGNQIREFFIINFPRLRICELNDNIVQEISIDGEFLESINLRGNPLQSLHLKNMKHLVSIDIQETKLSYIPKFPVGISVRHDDDFTLLLNRTEFLMRKKQKGKVKLPKGDAGIFNNCWITETYCQYSHVHSDDEKADHEKYELFEGVSKPILELVKKLLLSNPVLRESFSKMKTSDFVQNVYNGLTIRLEHAFFKAVELSCYERSITFTLLTKSYNPISNNSQNSV